MAKTSSTSDSYTYSPYFGSNQAVATADSIPERWFDRHISIKWTLASMLVFLMMTFFIKFIPPLLAGGHGGGTEVSAVKVDGLVVNLNEEEDMHYLKSSFEIEPVDPKEVEKIQGKIALIRHEMMMYLSSLSVTDTQGEKNKTNIRSALLKRLENALESHHIKIKNLYFTEFVIQ